MFGEAESESPRVPSPWDSVISTPPSQDVDDAQVNHIPKLVPEAEEGNIEYKLQLLSPSPARFARLVTQLKWRLLEGGGQAYYELGVADSGALVGLPRAELEQSLETLEMMAGEIGASVIVVKEIEVPAVMAGLAASETDNWNSKRRRKRAALFGTPTSGDSSFSAAETETELTTTDATTDCEDDADLLTSPFPMGHVPYHLRTHSALKTHSPPTLHALDASLALFSMDPESDIADIADIDDVQPDPCPPPPPPFTFDLEIASVFKPRPVRNRTAAHVVGSTAQGKHRKRAVSPTKSKKADWQRRQHPLGNEAVEPSGRDEERDLTQTKQQAKFLSRRLARDRRREEKRKALLTHVELNNNKESILVEVVAMPHATKSNEAYSTADNALPSSPLDETSIKLVSGLKSLHVNVDTTPAHGSPLTHTVTTSSPSSPIASEEGEAPMPPLPAAPELRLIVEALVVRKLSLDEAFLDFGGFSLVQM